MPGSNVEVESVLVGQVCQRIRQRIARGVYRHSPRLEPERKLSVKLGVSRGTVRAALRALEHQGVIRRLPNRGAVVAGAGGGSAATARRDQLLFVRWLGKGQVMSIIDGMYDAARDDDENPFSVADVHYDHERFLNLIRRSPHGVKGMLLSPFDDPRYVDAINEARAGGMKFVFVDRRLEAFPEVSSVTADHFATGQYATSHLLETHRRPAYFIGWTDGPTSRRDRYHGWANAMEIHGFTDLSQYVVRIRRPETEALDPFRDVATDGRAAASTLFERAEGPYCICAANDAVAQGVYTAASDADLAVGRDVFVVGYGDRPLCRSLDPPLSSIRPPYRQLGLESVAMLRDEINGRVPAAIHKVLPVELKVRESSTG